MSTKLIPKTVSYTKDDLFSGNGKFRTQSLFWEYRHLSKAEQSPVFSIKEDDYEVDGLIYPSLKKIYMSYDHVPGFEYEFANTVLAGWQHWQAIQANKLFTKYVQQWQLEKEIELQSKALQAMIHTAITEGSKGQTAAKYLADKGWKGLRGRPSKEEVERNKKEEARLIEEMTEDIERMGLTIITGGK